MHFTKMQGAGNDYVLVETVGNHRDWSKLVQVICDRRYGVGADSLLIVLPSDKAQFRMRVFDPDGSEAEVCGNGLRCFAKDVIDRQIAPGPNLTVETLAGIRTIEASKSQGKVSRAEVNMGMPRFGAEDIPVLTDKPKRDRGEVDIMPILDYPLNIAGRKLTLSFVSIGNPHAVSFLAQPVADFPLSEIGTQVENHPMFPERVNFEIARVLNRDKIEARVWERGAGETLSCGSGACAVAVIARMKGYTDDIVDIMLPGGNLTINWDRVGEVYLSGPVEDIFTGEWLR